jgi:hypothetical protein
MARLTAARGLVTSPNELSVPEGSLVVADNIVLDFENTIQQRRGFKEYSNLFNSVAKQLFTYKNRILAHYEDTIAFDNGSGTFTDLSGTFNEMIAGFRMKALETSGNCYFTTDNGIKKISVASAADLSSTTILNAGAAKAIDLSGRLITDDAGFLPAQSKVAYRLVFGYKDASQNLLLGAPSARVILTNQSTDVESSEIFTVNVINHAGITDGEYFTFDTMEAGYLVWFKVTNAGTVPVNGDSLDRETIEVDIQGLSSDDTVAAAIANAISTAAGEECTVALNSAEVEVTITTAGDAPDVGQGTVSSSDVLVTTVFDGSVTEGKPAKAELTFTLPPDVDTTYFYQVYRTGTISVSEGVTLNDLDPGDEQYFLFEYPVTAADVTAGEIIVEDNTPDAFRAVGAYLYTNAITGQGITQANERPPIALDLALFRNSTFYANTKDLHRQTFTMLSVDNFTSGTTKFYIGKENEAVAYTFRGVAEVTDVVVAKRSDTVGNSYFTLNSANDEREYYVWLDKGLITHNFDATTAVDAATDMITVPSHGFTSFDPVVFSGTTPGGITAGTTYYVDSYGVNQFKVSTTPGGGAVDITTAVGTCTVTHTPADPEVANKLPIRIPLELYADTAQGSKDALMEAITFTGDWDATDFAASTVRLTCTDAGNVTNPTGFASTGWNVSVQTQGDGEDTATREVLLSQSSSVGVAIDLTARSLVHCINRDADCPVTATYLSGSDDLPGKILLESKTLDDTEFYIAIDDATLSSEFSPELAVKKTLSAINSTTNVFTTSTNHGFVVGDEVYVNDNPNGTPVEFGNAYTIATVPSATTFTLTGVDAVTNQPVIAGAVYLTDSVSDNNEAPNRIYFSKVNQPEAVPVTNYIDVGSKDKIILRVLALRDNLFVLKEDGIYIVTGASAPNFSVRLLDNSAILIAPDSAVVLNNLIYCLTSQGVVSISDSGVSIVSRQIEDLIKKVTTFAYDFRYTSFGVSYESDRAYLLWLPSIKADDVATQCFRYSTITNTWTRWTKSNSCGIVNALGDDRMYLAKADGRDYIEQERKDGERQDYADRNFTRQIGSSAIATDTDGVTTIIISSVTDVEEGDVLTQEQYVSIPKFNRLLQKLDEDPGTATKTYYDDLNQTYGADLGEALQNLVTALNADANLFGAFTAPSGSNALLDLQTAYNTIITELNGLTSGTVFKNYEQVTDLLVYEVLIEDVNANSNTLTVNRNTWFIQGDVEIYKAIISEVQWSPQHFGSPEIFKQVREATLMFDQGSFYGGVVAFSTDRSASFVDITFTLDGVPIVSDFSEIEFEIDGTGSWSSFDWSTIPWGGLSNGRPVRTLIPQEKSRCRYMNVKFTHSNAREEYKLIGMSLEPREVSTRAYR